MPYENHESLERKLRFTLECVSFRFFPVVVLPHKYLLVCEGGRQALDKTQRFISAGSEGFVSPFAHRSPSALLCFILLVEPYFTI